MSTRFIGIGLVAIASLGGLGCKSSARTENWTPPPALAPENVTGVADPLVPPPVVQVHFAASEDDVAAQAYTTQFSLATAREVLVVALWEPRQGTHVERIEYYTPDGALYRSVDIPFTSDPQRRTGQLNLTDHIGSVPVRLAPRSGAVGVRVVDGLLVSGTPILTNVVAGTWSVRLFYDGQGPLATASFEVLR